MVWVGHTSENMYTQVEICAYKWKAVAVWVSGERQAAGGDTRTGRKALSGPADERPYVCSARSAYPVLP